MSEICESPLKIRKGNQCSVQDMSSWLIENNWKIVSDEFQLVEKFISSPAILKPILQRKSQIDIFFTYLPTILWNLLVTITNRNLAKRDPLDGRNKTTTLEEMFIWYSIQIMMENTYGNVFKDLPSHFAHIKKLIGGKIGIGSDRFRILTNSCCPTVDELIDIAQILNDTFRTQIVTLSVAVIDESIISYQPSKLKKDKAEKSGNPIPIVFIPGKPHPNGLECFVASSYITDPNSDGHFPFIVSLVPHVRIGDFTNCEAAIQIIRSWNSMKIHWVVDAGYGSQEIIEIVENQGSTITASFSELQLADLWNSLEYALPPGCWRVAINKFGWMASVHCGDADGKKRNFQKLISTNWELSGLSESTNFPIEIGSNIVTEIADSAPMQINHENHLETELIPCFTKIVLDGYKVSELKLICRKWGIRSAARKESTINNILARVAIVHKSFSVVERTTNILKSNWFSGPGPFHLFYKEHFKWVDQANRSWYAVEEHHHHQDWRSKYFLILLRFALQNNIVHSKIILGENL